ncbi:MAG: glycerol-3-phosphate dehydrogenase/oxidase [Spirochaetia bacterium]|nr:glycerol-3-phosphate dehydrogenase/oxidase [Spirochaetia bacterium]
MEERPQAIRGQSSRIFDVLVIGGGINGAVSAASLSGQGACVALVEKNDFGSFTSQESSNLVWGGIKYLETYEFALVRDLCLSRNFLLRQLPDQVREIRFLSPHAPSFRRGLGLLYFASWFYWFIGNFATRTPKLYSQRKLEQLEPGVRSEIFDGAMEYSDGILVEHDSRFVFHFIREAQRHGAEVLNYAQALPPKKNTEGIWECPVRDQISGKEWMVRSRVLVNAAGPYAASLNEASGVRTKHGLLLSKGVHLITRRLTESDKVLAFFADDGRLFFAIPMGSRSCIGTTDTRVTELPASVTEEDRDFILRNINKRLRLEKPLTREDIISERCGVRPLAVEKKTGSHNQGGKTEDWMKLSRKHEMEVNRELSHITLFGGKLTDAIAVGREAAAKVRSLGVALPRSGATWWRTFDFSDRKEFFAEGKKKFALDDSDLSRLWMRYGSSARDLFPLFEKSPHLTEPIFPDAEYLLGEAHLAAASENVVHFADLLRRRTRMSLLFHKDELAAQKNLREAAAIIFGKEADQKWKDYFNPSPQPEEAGH